MKNDHLGFEILCVYRGVVRKYRLDFLVRFKSKNFLVLETKGKDTEQDQRKRDFLGEWVNAVNAHGGFVQIPLSQVPRRETVGSARTLGAGALVDRALRFIAKHHLRPRPNSALSLTCPRITPTIVRLHDWPNHLALPRRRKAGRRRHGRGLQS